MLPVSGVDYVNVSGDPDKTVILSSLGSGAALIDYDNDGDLDIYFVNGALLRDGEVMEVERNRLYRNDGDWTFTEVTDKAGVGHPAWGFGVAVGDVDNDGAADLYVTNLGPDVLFVNHGDGTFSAEETPARGLGDRGLGTSAAFLDLEGDGDLDLYLVRYVDPSLRRVPSYGTRTLHAPGIPGDIECRYRGVPVFCGPEGLLGQSDRLFENRTGRGFEDVTRRAGIHDLTRAYGLGVVVSDLDSDGDADIYVANDSVPNFYFRSRGDGVFEELADRVGVAVNGDGIAEAGMGVDAADVNGDGHLDILVTNFSEESNTLYQGAADGIYRDQTVSAGLQGTTWLYLGWATRLFDIDNDGDNDLMVANGHVYPQAEEVAPEIGYAQNNQLFLNDGTGRFVEVRDWLEGARGRASSRGGAFGDIDNDGRLDAVIVNIDGPPSILRNITAAAGHWISVKLVGVGSNRSAIGARIALISGSRVRIGEVRPSGSYLSSSDPRVHFGLGQDTGPVDLRIEWPGGRTREHRNLHPDRHYVISEAGAVWSRPGEES